MRIILATLGTIGGICAATGPWVHATGPGWAIAALVTAAWAAVIAALIQSATRGAQPRHPVAALAVLLIAGYGWSALITLAGLLHVQTGTPITAGIQLLRIALMQAGALAAGIAVLLLTIRPAHQPWTATPSPNEDRRRRAARTLAGSYLIYVAGFAFTNVTAGLLPRGPGQNLHPHSAAEIALRWGSLAIAGPYEEIILTAAAAWLLCGPRFDAAGRVAEFRWTGPRLAAALVLTLTVRTCAHLYYTQGAMTTPWSVSAFAASLTGVIVWVAIWSGGTLLVYLRFRSLPAIMAAHTFWDLILAAPDGVGPLVTVAATLAAMIVIMRAILGTRQPPETTAPADPVSIDT